MYGMNIKELTALVTSPANSLFSPRLLANLYTYAFAHTYICIYAYLYVPISLLVSMVYVWKAVKGSSRVYLEAYTSILMVQKEKLVSQLSCSYYIVAPLNAERSFYP